MQGLCNPCALSSLPTFFQRVLQTSVPLEANNTLLRGCVLRNVDCIFGIVIYTGNQTKVRTALLSSPAVASVGHVLPMKVGEFYR